MTADVDFCSFFELAGLTGPLRTYSFMVKQLGTEKGEPPLGRRDDWLLLSPPALTYPCDLGHLVSSPLSPP